MDEILPELDYAHFDVANRSACAADKGSLFGGPVQPAKDAVFAGKGSPGRRAVVCVISCRLCQFGGHGLQ